MAEALVSGTPVICSNRGACQELISPEVGFVCATEQDYLAAIDRVHLIKPADCREKVMREYHYLRMARDYVEQYRQEIGRMHAASAQFKCVSNARAASRRLPEAESGALAPAKQIAFTAAHGFKTASHRFLRNQPPLQSGELAGQFQIEIAFGRGQQILCLHVSQCLFHVALQVVQDFRQQHDIGFDRYLLNVLLQHFSLFVISEARPQPAHEFGMDFQSP